MLVSNTRRPLAVASIVCALLLSQSSDSYAAGPYDGEWSGSATSDRARCKPGRVTLTVAGRVVTGKATLEGETPNINGTVWEDGTFGATIGFQHLTGKFIGDELEGSFKTAECQWKILLRRAK